MMALDEGLESPFKNHFVSSLWGHTYSWPSNPFEWEVGQGTSLDIEWAYFADLLAKWCNGGIPVQASKTTKPSSAWDFLLSSTMHSKKRNAYVGLGALPSKLGMDYIEQTTLGQEKLQHRDILTNVLMILHAVYEDYKLDSLHWR